MSANIKRMWINQPSNHQPHHALHGRHVLAVEEMSGVYKCYLTEGDVISMRIQSICLSDGWPVVKSADCADESAAKRCRDCREVGMIHCSDPTGCNGPWSDKAKQPAAGVELTDGMALVPTRLTAENGAKSALSGEFNVAVETDCDDCDDCELEEICQTCLGEGYTVRYEPVSWTMIKDIWAAGISHFAKQGGAG